MASFPIGNPLLKNRMGQKPREIASQVLTRALQKPRDSGSDASVPPSSKGPSGSGGKVFIEELLEAALASAHLSPADRRLCQELVFGVTRWRITLDWLISQRVKRQFPAAGLRTLLQIGVYQIFWLDRIPAHAAVHEMVELAKHSGFGAQSGFVNAILRGCLREHNAIKIRLAELKKIDPPLGYSHPTWLFSRWRTQWDEEKVARVMDWNNTTPKTFARCNLLKTDPGTLIEMWRSEGVEYDFVRKDWFDENLVYELRSYPSLRQLPSFQQGRFYIQDPSTLLAAHMLGPQSGETILDLCAAPGGKLTYVAQLMANQGRLLAYDLSAARRELIRENCARLGIDCVQVLSSIPTSSFEKKFDRVLVDAPCSNTGVMRRRVDLRWHVREEEIQRLRGVQLELLRQAALLLKPRGTLVYSTCSLEPEENQQVVSQFLRERNEFKIEAERQLYPFEDDVDGAYVVRLSAS
jgi:16S rRNA (cytosine967-C5)-methyltransferase